MAAAAQVVLGETPSTIVDILKWRGQHQASRCAFSFMNHGKIDDLTYGELDFAARRIAGCLLERGLEGERALLSLPTGQSLLAGLFGCMYAGTTAVPVAPPTSPEDAIRVAAIVDDAGAKVVLTIRAAMRMATAVNLASARGTELSWVALDDAPSSSRAVHALSPRRIKAPAILQYTSGSTGTPRGVIDRHDNLMSNLEALRRALGTDERSRLVSWLPSYHDLGLIGGILGSLYVGIPALLLSSSSFIKRPISWLEAIRDYRATTSGGPTFAYDLCVQRTTPEQRAALDLSTWEVAFCGAEPIRSESLHAFAEAFAPSGFRREALFPCYGLAESTLMVTGVARLSGGRTTAFVSDCLQRGEAVPAPTDSGPSTSLVSCGRAVEGTIITIVDPHTLREKREGEIGEIWVRGRGVAEGYWGKPEETQRVFRARRSDDPRSDHLRTGDLGFIRAGELFVTGRCKDLIIVRGANHYPQDIEASVQASSRELRPGRGVAFSVEGEGGERVIIVQEVEVPSQELRESADRSDTLLRSVVEAVSSLHGIRPAAVLLVERGAIPVTSSGKLQRQAVKKAYLAGELRPVVSFVEECRPEVDEQDDTEEQGPPRLGSLSAPSDMAPLVEGWLCLKLGTMLGAKNKSVDPEQTFGKLGVDSVIAMEALLELEDVFNLVLEPAHFYDHPTPRALAKRIAHMICQKRTTGEGAEGRRSAAS
jgi:acyl-CoA synthetase (AMP-forming)/AMP-acid ligase II/acyl carrier protein